MSESQRKRPRVTPRSSNADEIAADRGTPYSNLRQLAGVIQNPSTPFERASSAGPASGGRYSSRTPNITVRTPGTAARTPRVGLSARPILTRRTAPTTPHAIRALRERANAARTPGQSRRRSGRVQRETPRDTLRDLSRILARTTKPIQPSPQSEQPTARNPALDDFDEGPDPIAPRLSMPLNDMYDDDSFHEAPPRQSLLPDLPEDVDNQTIQSLEAGRRAVSEDPRARFSTRFSDRFADLNELGIDAASEFEIDGPFINRRPAIDDDRALLGDDDVSGALADENTVELRAFMDAAGRRQSRQSEIYIGGSDNGDEPDDPTFRFTIPQRVREPSPHEDVENAKDAEYEDEEDEAVVGAEPDDNESDGAIIEEDLRAYRKESAAGDRSLLPQTLEGSKKSGRRRKELRVSKYGHEYPSFPPAIVKRLATGFARSHGNSHVKISKETLDAIMQATDWFFEQVAEDLASYAEHAGRKVIDDSDVVTLMKRQRQINANTTSFSLAQKLLPRELLQEIRMAPPTKLKKTKRVRMETIDEIEEEKG
ncbi:hypothetical protein AOQ84DRAFT_382334 [Glonium stellatum]|uniref:CENP-T/Histone H4 histone fold domain-containing protein n=1 Tax=Glonium stellatum TaxID=574774 RepID=A0A8E2ER01_9PEZI|nr:hypothetical protein AOQ84DRAFT_382334 [Glonium stellatum]